MIAVQTASDGASQKVHRGFKTVLVTINLIQSCVWIVGLHPQNNSAIYNLLHLMFQSPTPQLSTKLGDFITITGCSTVLYQLTFHNPETITISLMVLTSD